MRLRALLLLGTLAWVSVSAGPAASPAPPAAAPPAISFTKQVGPVLTKHCSGCHGGPKPRAGLALDRYKTDQDAHRDRATWEKVVRVLQNHEMPPPNKPPLAPAERDVLMTYLDQQLTAVDCTKQRDPGRVTIRRLNRAEYNNTIRDLLGVPFQPADDFPADDVGYGFDNIGDVLSLPPVLMEKYLAAAERIVSLAFDDPRPGTPASPSIRFSGPQLPSTLGRRVERGQFQKLDRAGEVYGSFRFPKDGEYTLGVRAYAQQAGHEPARVAFRIDGKDVGAVNIDADAKAPKTYEVKVQVKAGERRVSAAFVNEGRDANDPKRERAVFIQELTVVGSPEVRQPPEGYRRVFVCQPGNGLSEEDCARRIIAQFARRAFRRLVDDAEVERYLGLVRLARREGETFEKSIGVAIQAILVSPHFLFRVEVDREPNNSNAVHPISEFELATRLSYFLWSSMPDDELFALAERGELRKNLEPQVRRMLRDPKISALVENFAGQWLQVRNLKTFTPAADHFPDFDEPLRAAMIRETELFFEAIMNEDRSILDFLDADFTFVNERLARHYKIPNVRGKEFRRVSLAGTPRGGILTHASILTVTSNPTRTSPVKRGKWILENILNSPPPPPPPDAPELKEDQNVALSGSLRQRMEQHRQNAICASCHARMDALGFAFENFDAIGAWRTKDGKFDIDPAGQLPSGESFRGPAELKAILKKNADAFARCLAEKMLTFALGRGLEYYDRCAVDDIVRRLKEQDYRFTALVLEVVKSDPFQYRRSKRP
ncbi:MAG: DUF1592 domain-containing protein [Gemmataceae bacterium]|nr:DUF1592 domain-containing protein [Gemmataceae bacterium]MDW8265172.1 DUF1592 domain-containing protein [Gemmataceae bacterium]